MRLHGAGYVYYDGFIKSSLLETIDLNRFMVSRHVQLLLASSAGWFTVSISAVLPVIVYVYLWRVGSFSRAPVLDI